MLHSPHQHDLFTQAVFANREPVEEVNFDRFRSRLKRALSAELGASAIDRERIAQAVSAMPGIGQLTKTMLDAYCSEAKPHDISVVRFKAIARCLRAPQLWDVALSDDGLLVLRGDEARLAEIARLQQEQRAIARQLKRLTSVPVAILRQGRDEGR